MESVEATELPEAWFAFACDPLPRDGIETPTWLKAAMMLCMSESFPPELE